MHYLKGIVQPFELGGVTRLIRSAVKFCMAGNFNFNFDGTISREELKTDLCALMNSEMTLSNQSHFPRFFSPRKMTYRKSGRFRLTTSRNRQAPVSHLTASTNRGRWLTGAGRFRLTTSRNWPGPGKSSSGILGLERMQWLSFVIL